MSGGIIGELNRVLGLKNEAMETLLIRERQLAERDAELARLRGALEKIRDTAEACLSGGKNERARKWLLSKAVVHQIASEALSSSPAGDEVVVKRETLEWLKARAVKKGATQIAFVCDKLLRGEGFSPLRDGETE